MSDVETVYLEERVELEGQEPYIERWLCPPPAFGVSYQVIKNEWQDGNPTVRTIREIRLAS